jgi:hypothetical protein
MPEDLRDLARAALVEITPATSVGADAGEINEGDGVVSVLFACLLPGYPGWRWTVTIARHQGLAPSVLETELIPAEGALLAPDWVPWSERLAEWKAAQAETAGASVEEAGEGLDPDLDDLDDDDDSDESVLHGGDLDGVDIEGADIDPEADAGEEEL